MVQKVLSPMISCVSFRTGRSKKLQL